MKHAQEITLQEAQQQVDGWIRTIGVRYFNELTNLGILMEEIGELAEVLQRLVLPPKAGPEMPIREELEDELSDVLWVVICLSNQTGVNLTTALNQTAQTTTVREAQAEIAALAEAIGGPDRRSDSELTTFAFLVREAGRLSRVMVRTFGEQSSKPSDRHYNLPDALGGVLFGVLALANVTGVDLTAALYRNLEKKSSRDRQRHSGNDKLRDG